MLTRTYGQVWPCEYLTGSRRHSDSKKGATSNQRGGGSTVLSNRVKRYASEPSKSKRRPSDNASRPASFLLSASQNALFLLRSNDSRVWSEYGQKRSTMLCSRARRKKFRRSQNSSVSRIP